MFPGQIERSSHPHNLPPPRRQVTKRVGWTSVKAVQEVATDLRNEICLMDWVGRGGGGGGGKGGEKKGRKGGGGKCP
jgi:hypothetical protein